jgi:hypothetical protein
MNRIRHLIHNAGLALLLVFATIAVVAPTPHNVSAQAPEAGCAANALQCGAQPLIGKEVMYQLTDDEGGITFNQFGQLEPFGRKVPAIITGLEFKRESDGSLFMTDATQFNDAGIPLNGRISFLRSSGGQIVVCLHILRPANKGGAFDKCDVPLLKGREPGTADTIRSADLVGI